MSNKLPPIESLSSAPHTIQQVLDTLFEPAPALYPLVAAQLPRQFTSYDQFIDFVASLLFSLARDRDGSGDDTKDSRLQEILSAHPRLGETNIQSALSRAEQTSLAGDEAAQLRRLNERYEQTFPGLKYVVFVAGRPRTAIMQNMRERIARGDRAAELTEAIEAMRDIARDRAAKLAC